MRRASSLSVGLAAALLALTLFTLSTVSQARELQTRFPMLSEPVDTRIQAKGVFSVGAVTPDTFYYGGTVWDAVDGRWEAAEPSGSGWVNRRMWTWSPTGFGGIPHSGLNMDGWVGVDVYVDTVDAFRVMSGEEIGDCVIAGGRSLFCGYTGAEASARCYADMVGTGYGNNWRQSVLTPAFDYMQGDQITLTYDYANQTEQDYDSTYVILERYDPVAQTGYQVAVLGAYTGAMSGSENVDIDSYLGGYESVQFRIRFFFRSDGAYSDEDGIFGALCGAVAFDNVALTGDVSFSEDFEDDPVGALPAGWEKVIDPCGDFASAQDISDLPASLQEDPCVALMPWTCGVADSVIVLIDPGSPSYPHPVCQDSYVMSPMIDLSSHPGFGGKLFQFERFANLPLNDHVFIVWHVRYAPYCESKGWSPWLDHGYVYYTPEGVSCCVQQYDVSAYVSPVAEEVQVAVGVLNYCDEDPWWLGCSGVCNTTPYYDNVTFATYGPVGNPYLSMREFDYWQDQFAEDGTLNAGSTADSRTANYLSILVPPIFGDTLVCRGSDDNMEVYFVFRLARVGPCQSTTHGFFTSWFPGVTGGGWREARMDTAELTDASCVSTVAVPGNWMCAFHEDDPVALGNALPEGTEILPNNVFVPGTKIEYFLKSRYVASGDFYLLPDTSGGHWAEFEILPTMTGSCGLPEWPCMLVVDYFAGRGNSGETNADRIARHLREKGFSFDVFNRLGPTSDLRNGIGRWDPNPGQVGGPGTDKYNWGPGATWTQMGAYLHCILNTGSVYGYSIYPKDKDLLSLWLMYGYRDPCNPDYRLLWLSGDQVCRELYRRTSWNGRTFLNNTLCASYVAPSYQVLSGDYTYCLPMNGVAGGRIGGETPESYVIWPGVCPGRFAGQNVIDVSASSGCNAVREIEYHSGYDGNLDLAAVSKVNQDGEDRTSILTEAYDFCRVKTDDSQGPPVCSADSFLSAWIDRVFSWAQCSPSQHCAPRGDIWYPPAEVRWQNLVCGNKVFACPGVASVPEPDTCETSWVRALISDPVCGPIPNAEVRLQVGNPTCDTLLCVPVSAITDENGYAELYIRGGVDVSGGAACCSVSITITCLGVVLQQWTTEWLSPDLNGDGKVDVLDSAIFAADFGTSACRSDFNCDGVVDEADQDIFDAHYGHSCWPEVISVEERPEPPPTVTSISQNYPNPFNPATSIKFSLAEPGLVVIRIYDIVGRPVRTLLEGWRERGRYEVFWDGRDEQGESVASGVYFYAIRAPGCDERKKMVLLK